MYAVNAKKKVEPNHRVNILKEVMKHITKIINRLMVWPRPSRREVDEIVREIYRLGYEKGSANTKNRYLRDLREREWIKNNKK